MSSERAPTPVEQAKEAARECDDVSTLYDLLMAVSEVSHVDVFNEDSDLLDTFVEISFEDKNGGGTRDAMTILRRAGWQPDEIFWCRQWLRASKPGGEA